MGDFWKPTAELFSQLIERPKMTEKLLQKPPFKYLFDIVAETIKKTGSGNGIHPVR
jgi:TRAF3-interacting protein 1